MKVLISETATASNSGSYGSFYVLKSNAETKQVFYQGCAITVPSNRLPEVVSSTSQPIIENEITLAIQEVEELWVENRESAKPITRKTLSNAIDFLYQLSLHFIVHTEVSYYDNGEIGFDWSSEKGSLSVLIDEKNIYYFFKSKSGSRRKGSDSWPGLIPTEILINMNRLFSK